MYGFQPLETPAMENLDTLMGKYGEEGDKLIFKILNNGLDNPAKEQQVREEFEKVLEGKNSKTITERALKYDLTIPFARYVAMNHNQLTFRSSVTKFNLCGEQTGHKKEDTVSSTNAMPMWLEAIH